LHRSSNIMHLQQLPPLIEGKGQSTAAAWSSERSAARTSHPSSSKVIEATRNYIWTNYLMQRARKINLRWLKMTLLNSVYKSVNTFFWQKVVSLRKAHFPKPLNMICCDYFGVITACIYYISHIFISHRLQLSKSFLEYKASSMLWASFGISQESSQRKCNFRRSVVARCQIGLRRCKTLKSGSEIEYCGREKSRRLTGFRMRL